MFSFSQCAANRARLKTHITGVILHGHQTHFFVDIMQWPHDSNLVFNCIMLALLHQYKEDGVLPTILNLQLDNCGRENKNKYVLGFVALLVQRDFVKEVGYFKYRILTIPFALTQLTTMAEYRYFDQIY